MTVANSHDELWEWLTGLPSSSSAPSDAPATSSPSSTDELLLACKKGDFGAVLKSAQAKKLLHSYTQLLKESTDDLNLKSAQLPSVSGEQDAKDVILIAIAALNAFVQANWTGPDLSFSCTELLALAEPSSSSEAASSKSRTLSDRLNEASVSALQWKGEPAYHLCREPFLLFFSVNSLDHLFRSLASTSEEVTHFASAARLRAALVHNRTLDDPVAIDSSILSPAERACSFLQTKAESCKVSLERRKWLDILSRLVLERGLALQLSNQDRDAAELFVQSAKVHGFQYQLSGALGKRTKFQREDKTQLVLLARSRKDVVQAEEESREKAAESGANGKAEVEADAAAKSAKEELNSGWQAAPKEDADKTMPSNFQLNDDTLLEQTEFTSTQSQSASEDLAKTDAANQPKLSPFDQCILLALSLNIRNTSPSHGLTGEEIGAFVARVLLHPMNWSVYTMGLLLRSRLEATRTRTVERSVLQLQALIDQMPTADSSVQDRLRLFYDLDLPPMWEMQAELARRYASIGVIRSALDIFTKIEMWEEVVQCLKSLGRLEEGVEIVRDLLAGKKVEAEASLVSRKEGDAAPSQVARIRMDSARQAKYWCLLGDLKPTQAIENYEKGWSVSKKTSARAARSLGGVYFARQDYQQTVTWLKAALKVNPLYTRSWFILGCAYMRLEKWEEAATCFRRCTNLDDEDAESWNNLASCYLRMGQDGAKKLLKGNSSVDDLPKLNGHQSAVDSEQLEELSLDDDDDADSGAKAGVNASKEDTGFALRKLAHRALGQSLKFAHDSWRVWANYMIVSVDVGELREAARALARVVEIRSGKAKNEQEKAESVDYDVLDRLVSAVTRAPFRDEESGETTAVQGGTIAQYPQNGNDGKGLLRPIEQLFENTLLTRVNSSPRIWRAYARLLMWKEEYRACLEAQVQAWKSAAGDAAFDETSRVVTDKQAWVEGIQDLKELVELMENLGERPAKPAASGSKDEKVEEAMPDWKFKARSLVRSYMARTKDAFESEQEWSQLEEMRDELKR